MVHIPCHQLPCAPLLELTDVTLSDAVIKSSDPTANYPGAVEHQLQPLETRQGIFSFPVYWEAACLE